MTALAVSAPCVTGHSLQEAPGLSRPQKHCGHLRNRHQVSGWMVDGQTDQAQPRSWVFRPHETSLGTENSGKAPCQHLKSSSQGTQKGEPGRHELEFP